MSRADQLAYERHLDAIAVQKDAFDTARIEGREEGLVQDREEGEYQKSLAIARNLKQMNLSVTDIIKATGLTEKEIEEL